MKCKFLNVYENLKFFIVNLYCFNFNNEHTSLPENNYQARPGTYQEECNQLLHQC